jgi:hypothetical protein
MANSIKSGVIVLYKNIIQYEETCAKTGDCGKIISIPLLNNSKNLFGNVNELRIFIGKQSQ